MQLEIPIYHYFTGNPFVDAGIAALCALNQKSEPQQISEDDLISSANYISKLYLDWVKLGNLFTQNCTLLNPSNRKNREAKYKAELQGLLKKIIPASSTGSCAACGTREANAPRIFRDKYPLTGSGDLVNYFSFFEPGFPICAACAFAVQFVPLYLVSNNGRLFLVHSHNTRVMLNLAREATTHVRGAAASGAIPNYYSPPEFARVNKNECIVRLAQHLIAIAEAYQQGPYGEVSIRLYSFANRLQYNPLGNLLEIVDLPTEVFSFIARAYLEGLNKNLNDLFNNSGREIYRRLVNEESIRYFFVQPRERKIIGGWELFELYLEEVGKMEKERLEVIKRVGQRLYNHLKGTNFKELRDLETDEHRVFLVTLSRIQKETLIWEIDDYSLLFPQDEKGAIFWRETQNVLLGYIYEQMHKNKDKEG